MNVNFLNAYNENKDNALATLQTEYSQNLAASENILKASKMIDRLEHQISEWSKPEKFTELFDKELKENVTKINRLLTIDPENKLAANLAVKQLYRLTDVMDLSIKQMQNSHLYEDKAKQVENFRAMLGEFLTLMDASVDVNKDRVEEMQAFLSSKSDANQVNELSPSRDFSVINADLFQDSSVGFNRGFSKRNRKTLADLHTLIHQTLLGHISRKSGEINQDFMASFPEFVKTVHNHVLGNLGNNNRSTDTLPISLLNIEADYPDINLYYKVPLRNHSGTLKLRYNVNDRGIRLDYTLFGRSPERWRGLEEFGFVFLEMFTDTKFMEHKADNNLLNMQLLINQDSTKLEEVFAILKVITASTLEDNYSLDRCFEENDEFARMLNNQGLSRAILNLYRDADGNLDFKGLHEVIQELKGSLEIDILSKINELEFREAIKERRIDRLSLVLPKITDQNLLDTEFSIPFRRHHKEIIELLLPRISQKLLEREFLTIIKDLNFQFDGMISFNYGDEILNKTELSRAKFNTFLSRVTNQAILVQARDELIESLNKKEIKAIDARITALKDPQSSILNTLVEMNGFLKQNDPLKVPGGAAAAGILSSTSTASNNGYVIEDYEKLSFTQSDQQLAQHNPQREASVDRIDPSYNVSMLDNFHLLRVGAHIAGNVASAAKDGLISMFGANLDSAKVKEARGKSKAQLKELKDPLMDAYKKIKESYELKIQIHNEKPNQALREEIHQLKQLKEQSEQIMKDLLEARELSKKFKDSQIVKQAHLENLEKKIVRVDQESKNFFKVIKKADVLRDTSTEIAQIFGGNRADLPKLIGVEQLQTAFDPVTGHTIQQPISTRLKRL